MKTLSFIVLLCALGGCVRQPIMVIDKTELHEARLHRALDRATSDQEAEDRLEWRK